MTNSTHTVEETVARLRELLAKATPGRLIADTHHMQFYAGRDHGFLRSEGELVPVAAVVLGVEGVPQDQGRARLDLIAEAVNALPLLLDALASHSTPAGEDVERVECAIYEAECGPGSYARLVAEGEGARTRRIILARQARAAITSLPPSTHDELVEALTTCANTFWEYVYLHEAKGTEEGRKKADRNRELALMCETALIQHRAG